MLVNEIEYAYTVDTDAGKSHLECQEGLKETLECTRRIYAQRAPRDSQAAAALLEERLAAVVDAQGDAPFGRDLALVLRTANPAPRAGVMALCR